MLVENRKINTQVQVMINHISLERVYENYIFGCDHKICLKPHIKYVRAKLARSVAFFQKTKTHSGS